MLPSLATLTDIAAGHLGSNGVPGGSAVFLDEASKLLVFFGNEFVPLVPGELRHWKSWAKSLELNFE
jgi:hypothetical protein